MVVKKRQSYGSDGFLVPFVPRAPRSARGRYIVKRKAEDNKLYAIELLASLAGKLLQESESSASSNASEANGPHQFVNDFVTMEKDDNEPLKTKNLNVESCEDNVVIPLPVCSCKYVGKEFPCVESDSIPERSSIVFRPDSMEKFSDAKSLIFQNKKECEDIPSKMERFGSDSKNSFYGHLGIDIDGRTMVDRAGSRSSSKDTACSSKASMDLGLKLPALISPDNYIKSSPCKKAVHNANVIGYRSNVNFRDNDEKFFRNSKPISKSKAFRPPSRVGDRRIRRLLASRYWRAGPKLKDCDQSTIEYLYGGAKSCYRKRKMFYNHERCYREALYKRRKFFPRSLVVTSDGGFSSESVCNSPEKGINVEHSATLLHGVNGVSSSVVGGQASFPSKDSHVKFSIKSIRTPELVVEVTENATVASLKEAVLEAVNSLLGRGLHIGMLLHGKKVRNDSKTLLQSGITSKKNLDTLGFTLEPISEHDLPLAYTADPPVPLPCVDSQPMSRSPATPVVDSGIPDALPDPPPPTCSDNKVENNCESVCLDHTDLVVDNTLPESKALVAVPPVNAEALAVVPVNQKPKRSEIVQRRTRRPFSVTEVEALVTAVEELGTGRWRDVKLRSFEDADHRTYVDLKDKWKTLVHTATISPQQRRGEPVPQELLDRVLAAHAYWSQHQGRQHSKTQAAATVKIADSHTDKKGVEGNNIVVKRKGNSFDRDKGQARCTNDSNLCSNILTLT